MKQITIIIPNYKTPLLTRLCLRSLRNFTDLSRAQVIVVDNNSADESLEYLRQVEWITLMERDTAGETGPQMHARALDDALKSVTTPFFAVMHTDTIVHNSLWLDFLLRQFDGQPDLAGVGSWKLEKTSRGKQIGKALENFVRHLLFRRRCETEERYLRSHCAVYRTQQVRNFTRGFYDGETAGKSLHRMLVNAGFGMRFLSSRELGEFVFHLNHATMILNPSGTGRTSRPASRKKLEGKLDNPLFHEILNNEALDRL